MMLHIAMKLGADICIVLYKPSKIIHECFLVIECFNVILFDIVANRKIRVSKAEWRYRDPD